MNLTERGKAISNFLTTAANPYPGRGIVVGRSDDGKYLIQVYWIMGRSTSSRNRRFVVDKGRVYTDLVLKSIPADPLTLYNAMNEQTRYFAVSNGVQTDRMMDPSVHSPTTALAVREYEFEPDAPNFTPRIQGYCLRTYDDRARPVAGLGILRKSSADGRCIRTVQEYDDILPGRGYCVTTYRGDGNPLPEFEGLPLAMPLVGTIQDVAFNYWQMLNEDNKVALAVKFIEERSEEESQIFVINKHSPVD